MTKNRKKIMPRAAWVFIALALWAAVLVFFFFFLPRTPGKKFARILSKLDIEKPNVLLFTLDTTRADRLGCYGYKEAQTPVLDRLAAEGAMFDYCISCAPLTLPSHCSIMTGLYPTYHGVRVNGNTALSDVHQTLAESFAGHGYQCGAFIAAFVLDGRWGLKQGFHRYDDSFELHKYKQLDLGQVQRPGNQVVDAALAWMDQQKGQSFFTWVHLYDPHTPYNPPEPYLSQFNSRGMSGLYDGEIAFMDEQVGRCLGWLEQHGLANNTIVCIIADHGEGLGEHGELTHGYFIYDYAVRVPLIIKVPSPGFRNLRISSQVRTIDLFPTLLEMTGIPIPRETQGQTLLPLFFQTENSPGLPAYSESMSPNLQYGWSSLHSLRTNTYKYIEAPKPELYDLDEDPGENNNVHYRFPRVVKQYKKDLKHLMEKTGHGAPKPETANLDQDTLRRLATLGYIGAPVAGKKGAKLADPKDKVEVFNDVSAAAELAGVEKYKEAVELLESVLRLDPHIHQAKLLLSTSYVELGQKEKAKIQLDGILKDDPNNIQALISMGNILVEEGKNQDVISLAKKTLSVDNRNTQAYMLIGEVYMNEKNHRQALEPLRKAVEIQPKLTRNNLNLAVCLVGLKQFGEAETILKSIVEKYTNYPLAHYHLGLLYEEKNLLDNARSEYEKEISNYGICYQARFNLGKLLFKSGDRKGYIEQMREIVRIAPKLPEGHLFLARGLLFEPVNLQEIQTLVEQGISLAKTPDLQALGYFLLADIYSRKNQPAKVKQALEKATFYKSQQKQN